MPEMYWLTEQEQRAWRSYVIAHRTVFAELDRRLQEAAELPLHHYEILSLLSEQPRRQLRMGELADRLASSRSRLSHAAARLEERGLIAREVVAGDRRGQLARLTPAGMKLVKRLAPGHVRAVRELFLDRLSPGQLGRVEQACNRIGDYLESTTAAD